MLRSIRSQEPLRASSGQMYGSLSLRSSFRQLRKAGNEGSTHISIQESWSRHHSCGAHATFCAGAEKPPVNGSSPEESAAAPARGGAFPTGGGFIEGLDDAPDKTAEQVLAADALQLGFRV